MLKLRSPSSIQVMFAVLVGFASVATLPLGVTQNLSPQAQAPGPLDGITIASLNCDPVNDPSSCPGL